jgi:hypothetical protein
MTLINKKLASFIQNLKYLYEPGNSKPCKFQSNGWVHYFNSIISDNKILDHYTDQVKTSTNSCPEQSDDDVSSSFDHSEFRHESLPLLDQMDGISQIIPTISVDYIENGERIMGIYLMQLRSGILRIPVHSERIHEFISKRDHLKIRCYGPLNVDQIIEYSKSSNFGACYDPETARNSSFVIIGSLSGGFTDGMIEVSGKKINVHFHEFMFESIHFCRKSCYSILPGSSEHKLILNFLGQNIPNH